MSQVTKINGIPVVNTYVTGFTFNGINTFSIYDNAANIFNVSVNSFSATTISATTFYGDGSNLTGIVGGNTPYTTGFTYNNANTFTLTNNTGGTLSTSFNTVTGLTVNGSLSATTYLGLPIDIRVTGGTYTAGTATFTNNTGGTFSVSGFSTGGTGTDTYVTGVTISNGVLTISQNEGKSALTASTNVTRALTFNSNDMALNTAVRSTLTPLVMAVTRFAGTGAIDDAGLSFSLPNDYVGSPQFNFSWRAAATSANNAKIFLDIYTGTTNNLGSLTTAVETLSIISTPTNANTFIISSAVTSTLVLSGGDSLHLRVYRDPADAGDTFTGDLDMININFKYNSIS